MQDNKNGNSSSICCVQGKTVAEYAAAQVLSENPVAVRDLVPPAPQAEGDMQQVKFS